MNGKEAFYENFVSPHADPLFSQTVEFPFSEIAARLDAEPPPAGGPTASDAVRKFFLHVLAVDLAKPGARERVGRRFIKVAKRICPDLKGAKDAPN